MSDDRRWAARYQFLDQLWRGRDRIVCDREVEAALHAGLEGSLGALLGDVIPADGGDARAWVPLHNDRRAASFARVHSGTVFTALDEAAELAADEPWKVALIHLGADLGAGPADRQLGGLETLIEILAERADGDGDGERSVVLSATCGGDEDATYEALADLVAEQFGDGRIYGLTRPRVAGFLDFGPVLEPDQADESEPPPLGGIEFDNSLGSEEPRFDAFIAVIGAALPADGAVYIELPSAVAGSGSRAGSGARGPGRAESDELAALRVQLAEAQRRGDVQAIERQNLLEQLEHSEDRVAGLEEALEAQTQGQAPAETGQRLDALMASEQTLRWQLEQARSELEAARARPVEALEAELAQTRSKLDRAEQLLAIESARTEALEQARAEDREASSSGAETDESDEEPTKAQARVWLGARGRLEGLLRKLERGSRLSALELHRELQSLHRLL